MLHYKIISITNTNLISLQDAKSYLKIDHDDDDSILKDCIVASIEMAENFLNFSLRLKEVLLNSHLSVVSSIELPLLPFAQVVSCHIIYENNNLDVSERCFIDQDERHLRIAQPTTISSQIKLVYKAGFSDSGAVPQAIKQGILYHIAEIYDKQVVSNSFIDEVLRFYKPFRRVLI
jgi:hypothetical protein